VASLRRYRLLAEAEIRGARPWTADAGLVRAAAGSAWEDLVVLLEPGE